MSMPAVSPLEQLSALDPSLLYVFVAGPGTGEGVAIALPGEGWLIVDGCTVASSVVEQILRRWRRGADDNVAGFIWTHSHEDHSVGVVDALDAFQPAWLGLAGTLDDACRGLRLLLGRTPLANAGRAPQERQAAIAAAAKIEDLLSKGVTLQTLLAGCSLPLAGGVTLTVHAPDAPTLARVLSWSEAHDASRGSANEASVVFALAWGEHRLVFGGDLPQSRTGSSTPLDGGWRDVMTRSPELAAHALLKVPHHGSIHALHAPLISPSPTQTPRDWIVTPFAQQRLPRAAVDEGLGIVRKAA